MPSTSDFQNRFVVLFLMGASCLLTHCDDEEKANIQLETLIGKWRLIEEKVGVGPPAKWVDVDDGEVIQFNSDHSFTSTSFPDCPAGTFEVNSDTLFCYCVDNIRDFRVVEFKQTFMTLTPASVFCTEGCLYRYEKIN